MMEHESIYWSKNKDSGGVKSWTASAVPCKAIISEESFTSSSGKGRLNSSSTGERAKNTHQNIGD